MLLATLAGCDRDANSSSAARTQSAIQQEKVRVPAPTTQPTYRFAAGLREKYRAQTQFVQQFLETCLAGDYSSYRQMVSRLREPETRERFAAMYHGVRSVVVESLEPIELRDVPPPAYRVITAVELDPQARVAVRGSERRVAILIFQENGAWRMLPAPAALQPGHERRENDEELVSQSTSQPSYPWDESGDY